jgi:N-methylhydantoinase B
VWEWGGTNAPGYGDPLDRAPERVAADVAAGALARDDAPRVYGVVLRSDGGVDGEATAQLRQRQRKARLDGATAPSRAPVPLPKGVELRPLGGGLALAEVGGELFFVSAPGGVLLGRASEGYRHGCSVAERAIAELGPELYARAGRPGDGVVYREYLCPITGTRLDSEIARRGDAIASDLTCA